MRLELRRKQPTSAAPGRFRHCTARWAAAVGLASRATPGGRCGKSPRPHRGSGLDPEGAVHALRSTSFQGPKGPEAGSKQPAQRGSLCDLATATPP